MDDDMEDAHHLSPETVEEYFKAGVASAFYLSKRLEARLEIDPGRQEMRLICPARGSEPDVATYERITVERISVLGEQGDWYRLTIGSSDMHYEAYVLIESIVDQLRNGISFRSAVSESLATLESLLAGRRRIAEDSETGLIGELLVLGHAISRLGEDASVGAWVGPLSEEHDFGFEFFDAEVKTTRSEGRIHKIGSETQLLSTPGRTLYLVSIQLTGAGVSADAFGLPDLISSIRTKLDHTRRAFDSRLESLGWHDSDTDLYTNRFQLRALPRAYFIDDEFPAITGARLDSVVPQRALVSDVSYRVDATHLDSANIPHPLNDFCEEPL